MFWYLHLSLHLEIRQLNSLMIDYNGVEEVLVMSYSCTSTC